MSNWFPQDWTLAKKALQGNVVDVPARTFNGFYIRSE